MQPGLRLSLPIDEQGYQIRLQNADERNQKLMQIIVVLATVSGLLMAVLIYLLYRKVRHSALHLNELKFKLKYQSRRDPLTGLPNRRAFYEKMKRRAKSANRRVASENTALQALIILGIDQYKLVNDTFGPAVGDIVLIEISQRLADMMRENDRLIRWGSEEFLMFLNNVGSDNPDDIVERALTVVGATCIEVELQQLNVTVSIGYISLEPGDAVNINLENSLKLADAALYRAKIEGRNQAIGVRVGAIQNNDLNAMVTIDLDRLISEHKVAINHISGPAPQKNLEKE